MREVPMGSATQTGRILVSPTVWSGLNGSIMDSGSLPWEKSITRVAVNTKGIDASLLKQTTYITGDHR